MECKKCGAELPYNAYGDIKCQFCNAQNYVPIPEKKISVVEKAEIQKPETTIKTTTPMVEKETQRKGFPKGAVVVVILLIVVISAYAFYGSNSRSFSKTDYYTPPATTRPWLTTTPAPTIIAPTTTTPTLTTTAPPTATPAPTTIAQTTCRETQVPYEEVETYTETIPYEDQECTSVKPEYDIKHAEGPDINEFGNWYVAVDVKNMEDAPINLEIGFRYYIWDSDTEKVVPIDANPYTDGLYDIREVKLNPYETQRVKSYTHIPSSVKVDTYGTSVTKWNYEKCEKVTKFKEVEKTRTVTKYRTETVCD